MKKGFISSFGKKVIDFSFSLSKALLLAVENEINISPDPLEPYPPTLEIPIGTLLTILFNWLGRNGASVATTSYFRF